MATRLAGKWDVALALIPLLDRPPWERFHKGKLERYMEGYWQPVLPEDRLKLTQQGAQVRLPTLYL